MTPHAPLRRIVLLVNPSSGGVGPDAPAEAEALLEAYESQSQVIVLEGPRMDAQIDEALALEPDLLVILAGDGTARSAASRAGPNGPLIAPLPGGTMNMLPRALYGTTDWRQALTTLLTEGEPQYVAGGRVDDHPFYCAAILGPPALWAPAREAMRGGRVSKAWKYGLRAFRRAFSGRLRYSLDGARTRSTDSLVLISPLISSALDEPVGLEAAAMDTANAGDAVRLAAHALFDDWRNDPAVRSQPAKAIAVHSRSHIPALIDGESVRLEQKTLIRFTPRAFRALAPRPPAGTDAA